MIVTTLQLYLKGAHFQSMDIELPVFKDLVEDENENFELNCKLREEYVKLQVNIFRTNFIRQIIKCQYDYEIYMAVRSKMGEDNLIQDSIINH